MGTRPHHTGEGRQAARLRKMPQPIHDRQSPLPERTEAVVIGQRPPKRSKRIPAKNRRLVEQRSGGVCESCGDRAASDIHHRQYLSRGGTHDVHNLLALCGGSGGMAGGNHSGCHGRAHSDGELSGLSIGRGYRSELVPVLYRGSWVLPGDDGSLRRLNESTVSALFGET